MFDYDDKIHASFESLEKSIESLKVNTKVDKLNDKTQVPWLWSPTSAVTVVELGCHNCNQSLKIIAFKDKEIHNLKKEIHELTDKLAESNRRHEEFVIEKQGMNEQVEDLTRELFEEANKMVAEERRHCQELIRTNVELMTRLQKMRIN